MNAEQQLGLDGVDRLRPLWSGKQLAALLSVPGIGPKRARTVARRWPDPDSYSIDDPTRRQLGTWAKSLPDRLPEQFSYEDVRVIGEFDDDYPTSLRSIPDPPLVLWVRGQLSDDPSVAIVGTRHPSPMGRRAARSAAKAAVDRGFVVVSGLAFGIDIEAHRAAMEAGGKTVAVLAGGVHNPTPISHRMDAERIIEDGGALVSEVPPHLPPNRGRLVARNRIQAGLSLATVIVQAGIPSGTMHTARFTIEQDRELIVISPESWSRSQDAAAEDRWAGNLWLTTASKSKVPAAQALYTDTVDHRRRRLIEAAIATRIERSGHVADRVVNEAAGLSDALNLG